MYQEILQKIGLSLNEARVYEALLYLGEVNVNKISIKSKVHRRNVYDSLNKLIGKGLASETFIKGEKFFKAIDPERLKVHEVGVHALRAANGYEQPLKIFALGLPGYLPTEEGLSSYFEEFTGNTSEETMRDYAARVIAVDSVCQGLNFRQTFDRLKSYELTNDQAWNLAIRAHRAGGYIKDHVYLDGHRKVKEFVASDGDFNTLYVGKVGIEDLPLVRRLVKEGTLREAKYKPQFVK